MMTFLRRLGFYLRRTDHDAEMREELSHHLDLAAREAEARGLSPQAARQEAVRRVGPPGRVNDDSRDVWRWSWLDSLPAGPALRHPGVWSASRSTPELRFSRWR